MFPNGKGVDDGNDDNDDTEDQNEEGVMTFMPMDAYNSKLNQTKRNEVRWKIQRGPPRRGR